MHIQLVPDGLIFDGRRPISLCLPTCFWGPSAANAFHLPEPAIEPVRSGSFVGDTVEGGSVNCFTLRLTPHGNGTHTECLGHIVDDRLSVLMMHDGRLLRVVSLTVEAVRRADTDESYGGHQSPEDWLVTRASLQTAWSSMNLGTKRPLDALLIRVLWADSEPADTKFSGNNTPYFSTQAMDFLGEMLPEEGHLLTTLPSIDRENCGGNTPNHRIFWGLAAQARAAQQARYGRRLITEMVNGAVPVHDGEYVLDLQIAPFDTDAAPSRPLLYPPVDSPA